MPQSISQPRLKGRLMMIEFKTGENDVDVRLDHILAEQVPELSRAALQKLIKTGAVRVQSEVQRKTGYMVKPDLLISLDLPELLADPVNLTAVVPLNIVYEDEAILIVNKPVGQVVHPDAHHRTNTLVDQLKAYTSQLSDLFGAERAGILHRLDKDTEGLLIVARNNTVHAHLAQQFRNHQVEKWYAAMVQGNVRNDEMLIDQPIGRHPVHRHKMAVVTDPLKVQRASQTRIHVLQRYNTRTLLDVELLTGRTHQIRVHVAYIGHPVLGDPVYGNGKPGDAQKLQAYKLGFTHPVTGKWFQIETPISPRLFE